MQREPATAIEPEHDLLGARRSPLDVFVRPQSVALIGASEEPGSVGRTLAENLLASSFGGKVVLINPKRSTMLGTTCPDRAIGQATRPV